MIRSLLFVILTLCLPTNLFTEDSTALARRTDTVYVLSNDSLKVILSNKESISGFDWQENMPWVAALIIGILTVGVNVYVSKKSLKIASSQIDVAQQNSIRDFNKTVLSGNRQAWINEFRNVISQILSKTHIRTTTKTNNYEVNEEILHLTFQAILMLNRTTDHGFILALMELQNTSVKVFLGEAELTHLHNDTLTVKEYAHNKIEEEWERVKRGE